MIDDSIMGYAKLYISIVVILFLVAVGIFFYQLQQANNFTQYVNYQVQRHGGLTTEAITKIDDYNDEHYNGIFEVNSEQEGEKLPYGSVIDYKVTVTLEFLFFDIDGVQLPIKGSAVSLVR